MMNNENRQNIHACAIILGQKGLLIRGQSGSGKTTLGQRLINRWQSLNSYSAWVGDDRVNVETKESKSVAAAVSEIAGLAEQRYLGIVGVDHQPRCVLDLEVCLVPHEDLERLPTGQTSGLNSKLVSMKVPERSTELAIELIIERLKQI